MGLFGCAQDQLDEMKKWDVVLLNNLEMADKLPPTRSVGQFPEDYYGVCSDGDVFAKLDKAMPKPPSMAMNFKTSADAPKPNELGSLIRYTPDSTA